jgi:hypothetical protein
MAKHACCVCSEQFYSYADATHKPNPTCYWGDTNQYPPRYNRHTGRYSYARGRGEYPAGSV